MTSKDASSIFKRFQILMEDDLGPGKLITYGIASASLFAALYRIRPFARFTKPSDIPSHFLQSRVPLQGTVTHVEPSSNVLLMVDHQSLLPFPHFNNKAYLPVKICGINVTGNGVSWLQIVLNGKHITFVPIIKEKEYLECEIIMPQKDKDSLEVGKELIKLGLATVHEPWIKLNDKCFLAYKKSLASAQKWAVRRRNGYWHIVKQPTVLWKAEMFIINKMKSLLPIIVAKRLDL
ncbi:uncharacterized protein LOC105431696 isoform X1 [Pogonomyrmex barbatus]|uniref:Uncharacterized protein LOC105431696 isoform X1 n=1 Tax=Pogonomyrmex barbatus TaxID=144034 RepID=A0A6I9WQK4_9HYME|nr:uncharacterized protein LOC105431696 isoform X1 [Pogonomyrmex barbatus]XP_011644368.1 uncharacterized protein LOC105431696 isoform X1 [Pogonomyrmex barbatus]XP_011644370.1 uncharacterized protein LOC105431696 isoform X1 [Pogonomyrmex barbatus]XP_011644371.1 uncharacterized protein LOC105431696 isoform X1 [Pogonomyrmex barbatus]